ncbi:MAG: OmpA family protein [Bacteroidetes bacterium]|nr:OmpA family protein [Bacteroidota bacterium]
MTQSARFTILLFIVSLIIACSPVNRLLRKGSRAAAKGDLEKACTYYKKAYAIDSNNYAVNTILGVTLADFMEQYHEALPYLEKAEKLSPKDTTEDLFYALAKTYHFHENFDKALYNYRKMQRYDALEDDNDWFQAELKQRIEACHYAQAHPEIKDPHELYVANLGTNVNTKQDEYVPTLTTEQQLIFTSRRQDDAKEKIDPVDGKYYESMYIASYNNGRFEKPRRYTLPDHEAKSGFPKGHESIISLNPVNKKVFVFRKGKIYSVNLPEAGNKSPKKLSKTINFSQYQNHACLSKDEKTIYFTSEGAGGVGGNDIYKATKKEDGSWGEPENLGTTINTPLNEESPYISDDGNTLYFSSNGHPGYGEYDVFKSELINGQWTDPENLGKPINSVGKDVFLNFGQDPAKAYFASYRMGGKGDMDIYQVRYKPDFNKPCNTTDDNMLEVRVTDSDPNDLAQTFEVVVNDALKNHVVEFTWSIADSGAIHREGPVHFTFAKPGTYNGTVKIAAICDTCLEPYIGCKSFTTSVSGAIASTTPVDSSAIKAGQMGFDLSPVYFDLNKENIREDAITVLNKNIEVLKKHPEAKISIHGYTDMTGTDSHNQLLSLWRAEQVKKYLMKHGVKATQIMEVKGHGKLNPIVDCATQTCGDAQHQVNRRVEFEIKK